VIKFVFAVILNISYGVFYSIYSIYSFMPFYLLIYSPLLHDIVWLLDKKKIIAVLPAFPTQKKNHFKSTNEIPNDIVDDVIL
jgi:hypothetical protein